MNKNEEKTQIADGVASVLNAELGLLKDIINRVADKLNLPTENGNRVHDVLFWLDSLKTIECQNLGKEFENVLHKNLHEMYES